MADFLAVNPRHVVDSATSTECGYCEYNTGANYQKSLNINASYYGWQDVSYPLLNLIFLFSFRSGADLDPYILGAQVGITALFCISSYALVFVMMKLRRKESKTAN